MFVLNLTAGRFLRIACLMSEKTIRRPLGFFFWDSQCVKCLFTITTVNCVYFLNTVHLNDWRTYNLPYTLSEPDPYCSQLIDPNKRMMKENGLLLQLNVHYLVCIDYMYLFVFHLGSPLPITYRKTITGSHGQCEGQTFFLFVCLFVVNIT